MDPHSFYIEDDPRKEELGERELLSRITNTEKLLLNRKLFDGDTFLLLLWPIHESIVKGRI